MSGNTSDSKFPEEILVTYKEYQSPSGYQPWWSFVFNIFKSRTTILVIFIGITLIGLIMNLVINGINKADDPWLITTINQILMWIFYRLLVHILTELKLVGAIIVLVFINYSIWKKRLEFVDKRRVYFEEINAPSTFGKNLDSWGRFLDLVSVIYGIEFRMRDPPEFHKEYHDFNNSCCVIFCGYLCCVSEITKTSSSKILV